MCVCDGFYISFWQSPKVQGMCETKTLHGPWADKGLPFVSLKLVAYWQLKQQPCPTDCSQAKYPVTTCQLIHRLPPKISHKPPEHNLNQITQTPSANYTLAGPAAARDLVTHSEPMPCRGPQEADILTQNTRQRIPPPLSSQILRLCKVGTHQKLPQDSGLFVGFKGNI